jgi:hypothetical protein
VTADQLSDYAIFAEGLAPTVKQIERLLQTDVSPGQGFVEGGGDLWWIEAAIRQIDDVSLLLGGVVQFPIASGSIEGVHPVGPRLGEYLECADDGIDEVASLVQVEIR